jgi:hypothetical protein
MLRDSSQKYRLAAAGVESLFVGERFGGYLSNQRSRYHNGDSLVSAPLCMLRVMIALATARRLECSSWSGPKYDRRHGMEVQDCGLNFIDPASSIDL